MFTGPPLSRKEQVESMLLKKPCLLLRRGQEGEREGGTVTTSQFDCNDVTSCFRFHPDKSECPAFRSEGRIQERRSPPLSNLVNKSGQRVQNHVEFCSHPTNDSSNSVRTFLQRLSRHHSELLAQHLGR